MSGAARALILAATCAAALAPAGAPASPEVPERDPLAPFRETLGARAVVIEYFTASKNADAKRASSLVDYDEWGKELGLDDAAAKQWAQNHRNSLVDDYRREKAAGSTKEFKIIKSDVVGNHAVFEVTQDRATGVYRWEVKLLFKRGRWAITGFRLIEVK